MYMMILCNRKIWMASSVPPTTQCGSDHPTFKLSSLVQMCTVECSRAPCTLIVLCKSDVCFCLKPVFEGQQDYTSMIQLLIGYFGIWGRMQPIESVNVNDIPNVIVDEESSVWVPHTVPVIAHGGGSGLPGTLKLIDALQFGRSRTDVTIHVWLFP